MFKFNRLNTIVAIAVMMIVGGVVFHNCARAKFFDPDTVHSAFALGYCQHCGDETGLGVQCRPNLNANFGPCIFESCSVGFKLEELKCIQVICENEAVANCPIEHGEGRMVCSSNAYGACNAISCEGGYELQGNACVAVEVGPTAVCEAGSSRDCSTSSTAGTETCNEDGLAYGECVFTECKAGYHNEEVLTKASIAIVSNLNCIANTCEPNAITPCSEGAGFGFQTCNSIGSSWGNCILNDCQAGYNLIEGVCVVQACTPNSEAVCDINNGTGVKTCNANGTEYGSCQLVGCNNGYSLIEGQCVAHKCTPSSQETCQGDGGSGVHYCYENGNGYGVCQLNSCDEGFNLNSNQCSRKNDYCEPGQTFACAENNGTGTRTCKNHSNTLGSCDLTACNTGYTLKTNPGNGTTSCKKD